MTELSEAANQLSRARDRQHALTRGCERLLSENMQHGMVIENRLRIVDPFRDNCPVPVSPAR